MIETKRQIMAIVTDQIAHEDDRELWEVLMIALSDHEAASIAKLLEAKPERIHDLNENFKAKLNLLLTTEERDWHQLIDQEVELIKSK